MKIGDRMKCVWTYRVANMARREEKVAASSFRAFSSLRSFIMVSVTMHFSLSYLLFRLARATSAVYRGWEGQRVTGLLTVAHMYIQSELKRVYFKAFLLIWRNNEHPSCEKTNREKETNAVKLGLLRFTTTVPSIIQKNRTWDPTQPEFWTVVNVRYLKQNLMGRVFKPSSSPPSGLSEYQYWCSADLTFQMRRCSVSNWVKIKPGIYTGLFSHPVKSELLHSEGK